MSKEKQIEEMATVINEMDERNAHYYDKYMIECEAFADANAIAKALYNKGYRKQSEVVEEIFEKIDNIVSNLRDSPFYSSSDAVYELIELKKEYTEVKEDAEIH